MKKLWNYISHLGVDKRKSKRLSERNLILANRINFALLLLMVALSLLLIFAFNIHQEELSFATIRLYLIIAFSALNIFFAHKGYRLLLKINLIFIPSFIFTILSTFVGFIEEESFFYYPYVLIGFSTITQLIVSFNKEKKLFYASLTYYFILIVFIDNILSYFAKDTFIAEAILKDIWVFYKIAAISIFLFIHVSLFYLRSINYNYELSLINNNNRLISAVKKLKATQNELVETERMASIGTLTQGLAHELNNPLNFIAGGLNILKDILPRTKQLHTENDALELESARNFIKEGLTRSTHIMDKLSELSFYREEPFKNCHIADLIDKSILLLESQLSANCTITKSYDLTKPIFVNEHKVQKAIWFILDNAIYEINHDPKETNEIAIYTSEENNQAIISISNTAKPIVKDDLSKLYIPFFTTKPPNIAKGLGLTLCYRFVKEHNGNIKVRSPWKEYGACFTITLPLQASPT